MEMCAVLKVTQCFGNCFCVSLKKSRICLKPAPLTGWDTISVHFFVCLFKKCHCFIHLFFFLKKIRPYVSLSHVSSNISVNLGSILGVLLPIIIVVGLVICCVAICRCCYNCGRGSNRRHQSRTQFWLRLTFARVTAVYFMDCKSKQLQLQVWHLGKHSWTYLLSCLNENDTNVQMLN